MQRPAPIWRGPLPVPHTIRQRAAAAVPAAAPAASGLRAAHRVAMARGSLAGYFSDWRSAITRLTLARKSVLLRVPLV